MSAVGRERSGGRGRRGPAGSFFRRAAGSAANGVLAEKVSTRKPGPEKRFQRGGVLQRQDPFSDRSTAPNRTGGVRQRDVAQNRARSAIDEAATSTARSPCAERRSR